MQTVGGTRKPKVRRPGVSSSSSQRMGSTPMEEPIQADMPQKLNFRDRLGISLEQAFGEGTEAAVLSAIRNIAYSNIGKQYKITKDLKQVITEEINMNAQPFKSLPIEAFLQLILGKIIQTRPDLLEARAGPSTQARNPVREAPAAPAAPAAPKVKKQATKVRARRARAPSPEEFELMAPANRQLMEAAAMTPLQKAEERFKKAEANLKQYESAIELGQISRRDREDFELSRALQGLTTMGTKGKKAKKERPLGYQTPIQARQLKALEDTLQKEYEAAERNLEQERNKAMMGEDIAALMGQMGTMGLTKAKPTRGGKMKKDKNKKRTKGGNEEMGTVAEAGATAGAEVVGEVEAPVQPGGPFPNGTIQQVPQVKVSQEGGAKSKRGRKKKNSD